MPVPRRGLPSAKPRRDSAPEDLPELILPTAHPLSHFTHNGRFRITHTAGPLHFALSPGLKCPFPRSSHGWLLPFHLASARSPTSSKKPSHAINPPHNSHEQTSTFGSGPRAGCLSTPAHVDPHGWLSPLQHYRPSWPPSPPSPPRHYSHPCGRDAVTGQPI